MQKKEVKVISVLEIFILIIAIISLAYFIGLEFQIVSAEDYYFVSGDGKFFSSEAGPSLTQEQAFAKARGALGLDARLVGKQEYEALRLSKKGLPQPPPAATTPVVTNVFNSKTGITTIFKGATLSDGTYVSGKIGDFVTSAKNPVSVSGGGTIITQGAQTKTYSSALIATEDVGLKGRLGASSSADGPFEGISKIYGIDPSKTGFVAGMDAVISSAAWGLTAYFAVKFIGGFLGVDKNKVDAAAKALGFGTFAGRGTFALAQQGNIPSWLGGNWAAANPAAYGFIVGAGVAIAIYLLTYKEESQETVTFECLPWQAPIGGAKCEECNGDPLKPCSLYRCKSLGQACDLVNVGTDQQQCVWANRKDVKPPVIKTWNDPLLEGYEYRPDNSIQPPDVGVKIIKKDSTTGCIKAFTPLRFGIATDEPSQCKIDYNRPKAGKNSDEALEIFNSMQFFMGGLNLFSYNHTEILSLPGPTASVNGSPVLENDGRYSLFIRCQDANGNANLQSFTFNFCVEKGPDTTPPLIVTTSILNNAPVAYNTTSVDIDVYVNEPSSCKWSRTDLAYKDMENIMSCSSSVFEMNANLLYKCKTTLTGLKNSEENKYYFKCEDNPQLQENDRNVNTKSYEFTLIGTRTLNIIDVKPNGTIKDATNIVAVILESETANGYKNGEAICYYSPSGEIDSYIEFRNTNSNLHSQVLNLPEGNYQYFIRCIDLGGNTDTKQTSFKVETDTASPIVVRVFHDENKLKLITNENATCSYSIKDCNFKIDDGIKFRAIKGVEHFADWNIDNSYYIRCVDQYGREPLSNQCSIVVRPVDLNKKNSEDNSGLVA